MRFARVTMRPRLPEAAYWVLLHRFRYLRVQEFVLHHRARPSKQKLVIDDGNKVSGNQPGRTGAQS